MKKEKSKVLSTILTIIIGLLLVINLFFQNREQKCFEDIGEFVNDREILIYDHTNQFTHMNQWSVLSVLRNFSNFETNDKGFFINMAPDMRDYSKKLFDNSAETQREISSYTEQIETTRIKCKAKSLWADVFLYTAIIVNLLALGHALRIYSLYKS